jgi:hypothetical protein
MTGEESGADGTLLCGDDSLGSGLQQVLVSSTLLLDDDLHL